MNVNISIPLEFYSRFEAMPNTVSHTLAEFIDNAIQSFNDCEREICRIDGKNTVCTVDIEFDFDKDGIAQCITILDNAGGISNERLQTALQPSIKNDDVDGLHEFGVGMKTAALWLGHHWELRTKRLGEITDKKVVFDLATVKAKNSQYLPVLTSRSSPDDHYTEIKITQPTSHEVKKQSLFRINDELASIYRTKLSVGKLKLIVNGVPLKFEEFPILNVPYCDDAKGTPKKWKVEFPKCTVKDGKNEYSAKGFLALLEQMNQRKNRIVFIRRDRVIIGVGDNQRYYFQDLCGQKGSPVDKRLFGEIELEGFDVYFNKNDIRNQEKLEQLMAEVKKKVDELNPFFFRQAKNYRSTAQNGTSKIVKKEQKRTKDNRVHKAADLPEIKQVFPPEKDVDVIPRLDELVGIRESSEEIIDRYDLDGKTINLRVSFEELDNGRLFTINIVDEKNVVCCINSCNSFMERMIHESSKSIEKLLPMIRSLAVAQYKFSITNPKKYSAVADFMDVFNQYLVSENV